MVSLQKNIILQRFAGQKRPFSELQIVQIFFGTATFDEIERDERVKMDTQLSLVGGTMGLFTGFSILSGVEIVYHATKFFISLKYHKQVS